MYYSPLILRTPDDHRTLSTYRALADIWLQAAAQLSQIAADAHRQTLELLHVHATRLDELPSIDRHEPPRASSRTTDRKKQMMA